MIAGPAHRSLDAGPRSIAARRLIGVALSGVALLSMNACYAFVPTTNAALPVATPVTVTLTLGGTVALQPTLGEGVTELEGTIVRATPDSLVLAVEKMYTVTRQAFASSGTTAAIPRPYINEVKVRTFSRKRTVFTIMGALAAAIAAARAAGLGSASGDPGGGVVPPP